jgi:hypothetical protein
LEFIISSKLIIPNPKENFQGQLMMVVKGDIANTSD